MIDPKEFTQREAINSLTGIKSSLGNLRKVVSLTYLLYLANKKKSSIVYAESKEDKIVLKQEYKTFIQQFLNNSKVIEKIDDNPLLTSQIESLYVGLTLMFAFGRISFEDTSLSMTKERTGGIRYPKKIEFASNIMTLDLMLNADSKESVKATLLAWLQDEQLDNKIEQRISIFLNICIENNLFKLRHGENDLYFQTEGIYKSLITGDEVSLESDEIVGPTRILNSMLRENLVPWLNIKKSLVTINADNDFNVKEYSDIISTSLSIRDIKVDNNVESAPKEENTDNDIFDLPLQQITYGAPGTGKSHGIKEATKGHSVIRTTFHPDSDYSTFVGAYKPVMEEVDARVVPVVLNNGASFNQNNGTFKEKRISYKFVKQAFLKAYLGAWKKYAKGVGAKSNIPTAQNTSVASSLTVSTNSGFYTLTGISSDRIFFKRDFEIKKSNVQNVWNRIWSNGSFTIPTGTQPGMSLQFCICDWINKNITNSTSNDFEKGWTLFMERLQNSPFEHKLNRQTYEFSLSNVVDTVHVQTKNNASTRKTLQDRFANFTDNSVLSSVEDGICSLLNRDCRKFCKINLTI